jgi:Ca-activated chloride channel family protein
MKLGQVAIALLAVAAVAGAFALSGGKDDKGGGGGAGTGGGAVKAPKNALVVKFRWSPEKDKLLVPLIKEFNAGKEKVGEQVVFVDGAPESSGETETKLAKGTEKALVAWSPASSLWGRLLNFEADRPFTPDESPSLVRTPLVVAMWEPMARALGWPKKQLGFADILKLATEGTGWAKFGHPEFGQFKLVHTNPDLSTSGLSAVVAEYYAATGKKEGLREADVTGSKARALVRGIERSIVHYGDTTLFIADQMRKEGPGYASAVAMEEVTLLDFNRNRGSQPKLVAIYPSEGTFYSDSPFIVLDAPWVKPEQKEAAQKLQAFLAERLTPEVAARGGFRPADLKIKPVAPITVANGVDPAQPERVLGLPEPRVLAAIKRAWRDDRKPANILLVLDTSGSMGDENRLQRAKSGLGAFLRNLAPQDSVGLLTFNDKVMPLIDIGPFPQVRGRLQSKIDALIADGGTAVYDAAVEAFQQVRTRRDPARINAVVLLTDGEDTDSQQTLEEAVQALQAQGDSENRVRMFTIAYSAGAQGAADALAAMAAATGGKSYEGSTQDIESVYRSISSFF